MLRELDSQIQQLIENNDELVANVQEAADVFMPAGRAVKWCQGKIKEMQKPSTSGAVAPSSGSLTTKLPNNDLYRSSHSCFFGLLLFLALLFCFLVVGIKNDSEGCLY